jgi:hypothetical protein
MATATGKVKMAVAVVKALRASWETPSASDPDVKRWAGKPLNELKRKHDWAVQAISAMTWNTMLAGGPVTPLGRRKR